MKVIIMKDYDGGPYKRETIPDLAIKRTRDIRLASKRLGT